MTPTACVQGTGVELHGCSPCTFLLMLQPEAVSCACNVSKRKCHDMLAALLMRHCAQLLHRRPVQVRDWHNTVVRN